VRWKRLSGNSLLFPVIAQTPNAGSTSPRRGANDDASGLKVPKGFDDIGARTGTAQPPLGDTFRRIRRLRVPVEVLDDAGGDRIDFVRTHHSCLGCPTLEATGGANTPVRTPPCAVRPDSLLGSSLFTPRLRCPRRPSYRRVKREQALIVTPTPTTLPTALAALTATMDVGRR
jgi:hypothetical protein